MWLSKRIFRKFIALSMLVVMGFSFVAPVVAHADDDDGYVGAVPEVAKKMAASPKKYHLDDNPYAGDQWSSLAAGNEFLGISTQNARTVTYSNLYSNSTSGKDKAMYRGQGDAATFGAALDSVGLDHSNYSGIGTDMFVLIGRGLFGGIAFIGYAFNTALYWGFKVLTYFAQYINIMKWISHKPTDKSSAFYGPNVLFYTYYEVLRQFYLIILTGLLFITIGLAIMGRRVSKQAAKVGMHDGMRHSLYRFMFRCLAVFVLPLLFTTIIAGVIDKVADLYGNAQDPSVDYAIYSNIFDFQGWVQHSRLALPESLSGKLYAGVSSNNVAYTQKPLSHQEILDMNVNGANSKAAMNAQDAFAQDKQIQQNLSLLNNDNKISKQQSEYIKSGSDSSASDMLMRWFRYSQYQPSDYASFIVAHMSDAYLDVGGTSKAYQYKNYYHKSAIEYFTPITGWWDFGVDSGKQLTSNYFVGKARSNAKKNKGSLKKNGLGNVADFKSELEKSGYAINGHLYTSKKSKHSRSYFVMSKYAYSKYGAGDKATNPGAIYDIAANKTLGSIGPGGLSTIGMYNYLASVFGSSSETWTESGKLTTLLTIPIHASVGLVGHGMVAIGNLFNMYALLIAMFIVNWTFLWFTFNSIIKSIPKLGLYAAMSFSMAYGIKLLGGVIMFSLEILGSAFLCQIFKQIVITMSQMFDKFATNPNVYGALDWAFGGHGNVAVGGALGANAYGLANVVGAVMLIWLALLLSKWRGPITQSIGKFVEEGINTIVQSFEATNINKPTNFASGDPNRPFLDEGNTPNGRGPQRPDAPVGPNGGINNPNMPNGGVDGKDGRPGVGVGVNGQPGPEGPGGVDGASGSGFGRNSGANGSLAGGLAGAAAGAGGSGKHGFFSHMRDAKQNHEAATGHKMNGREAMKYYAGKAARMGAGGLAGASVGAGAGLLRAMGGTTDRPTLSRFGDALAGYGNHLRGSEARREAQDVDSINQQSQQQADNDNAWTKLRESGIADRGQSNSGLYGKTGLGARDANNYVQTVYDDMKAGAGNGLGVSSGYTTSSDSGYSGVNVDNSHLSAEAANTRIHEATRHLNAAKQQVNLAKTPSQKATAQQGYQRAYNRYQSARKEGSYRVAKQPVSTNIMQEGRTMSKIQASNHISNYGRNVSNLKQLQANGGHEAAARRLAQKVQSQKQVLIKGGFREEFLNNPRNIDKFLHNTKQDIMNGGLGKSSY